MFHKKTEMSMPIIFILLGIAAFAYSMTIPKDDGMFLKIIALIMREYPKVCVNLQTDVR